MRINVKALPKDKLFHLFDLFAKMNNQILAMKIVNELTGRNHISIEDQLRKLGQRASENKNTLSFQMVSKLWNRW